MLEISLGTVGVGIVPDLPFLENLSGRYWEKLCKGPVLSGLGVLGVES